MKVLKFENDFKSFSEDRTWQINSWKENQKYFLKFLTKYRLNKLYAYGSYYYLLYKILRLRDLNLNLFLSYIIFYPYNLFKKFINYLNNFTFYFFLPENKSDFVFLLNFLYKIDFLRF